jgi:hypothetical protein
MGHAFCKGLPMQDIIAEVKVHDSRLYFTET